MFSGEKYSATYRRYLSDAKNKKIFDSYKTYIEESIKELEEKNGECLEVRAPKGCKEGPILEEVEVEPEVNGEAKAGGKE